MRKVTVVAGLVVALFAAAVAAQDAVEIKIDKPKVGDKVKVTVNEKAESKMTISFGGKDMAKNETKTKSVVYTDKVLAVGDGARRPTKLERTYEKAELGADGKSATLSVEGKTVVIEKKGDKYAFTVDGKELTGDAAKLLGDEFNKEDKDDPRTLMLPGKPVKPGDTWKIDAEKLTKGLGKDLVVDKSKIEATGKLVKAYKQDGKQFGVLELKITAPISDVGGKAMLKVKEGSTVTVTLTGDGVIDGSSPQGKSNAVMRFQINGAGDAFELKMDMTVTESRTTTPVK